MKKYLLFFLSFFLLLGFVSCTIEQNTKIVNGINDRENTEESSFQTIGNFINIQEERPFQSFMILNDSMGIEKVLLERDDLDWLNFVEFVVMGIKDELGQPPFQHCSSYYVKILDVFGIYEAEFQEKMVGCIYDFYYYGSPENQRYARPPFEIGSRYVAFFGEKGWVNYEEKYFGPSLVMAIEVISEVEYLYGRNVDLSNIEIAIKISDDEENKVYDEITHKAQIKELIRRNIQLPVYGYKLDYLEFKKMIRDMHQ